MRQQFRDSTMVLEKWSASTQYQTTNTHHVTVHVRMSGSNTVPVALIYMSGEISVNIVTVITRANTSLTQLAAIV